MRRVFAAIAAVVGSATLLGVAPVLYAASSGADFETLGRIRDEGLRRSQVMEIVGHLTDSIGPRLTGSPQMRAANDWTLEQFRQWGLANPHLEALGIRRGVELLARRGADDRAGRGGARGAAQGVDPRNHRCRDR